MSLDPENIQWISYRSVKSSVVTDLGQFDDVTKSSLKFCLRPWALTVLRMDFGPEAYLKIKDMHNNVQQYLILHSFLKDFI